MALPMALNQQKIGGYTAAQLPTLAPQQQQLQNQSIQQLMSMFGQGAGGFQPIAQQARNQFQQQTIPTLSERFTSLGSGSALSSPAFASQLGQAGAGLEGQLAALQSQHQIGQQGLLAQLASRPSFENLFAPPQQQSQGFANLLGGIGQGFGGMAPIALSSYLSAAPAAGAGSAAGLGGLAGLGALGPIGLALGGGAGLIALLNYLARSNQ